MKENDMLFDDSDRQDWQETEEEWMEWVNHLLRWAAYEDKEDA